MLPLSSWHWSSKSHNQGLQPTVAVSTTEAEYIAVAQAVREAEATRWPWLQGMGDASHWRCSHMKWEPDEQLACTGVLKCSSLQCLVKPFMNIYLVCTRTFFGASIKPFTYLLVCPNLKYTVIHPKYSMELVVLTKPQHSHAVNYLLKHCSQLE